jgi:hypothetical protein
MRLLFPLLFGLALPVHMASAATTARPDDRYTAQDSYTPPGSDQAWPLLSTASRYRVHLKNAHTAVLGAPDGDTACSRLGTNVTGTVVNDGFGDEFGWYLVKWDHWPPECKGHGLDDAWGFVRKEDAARLEDPEVEKILADLEAREISSRDCPPERTPVSSVTELLGRIISDTAGLKNKQELQTYLDCYSTPHQKEYQHDFKPMIELAEQVFGVPSILLTCLLRRESSWDKEAVSPTGAVGLGQHLKANSAFISRLIGDSPARRRAHTQARSTVARQWDYYMNHIAKTRPELLKGCSGGFDLEDRTCPAASIAAASVYLVQIQKELNSSSKIPSMEWEDFKSHFVTAAAAYNIGNGFASKAVKGLSDSDEWVDALMDRPMKAGKRGELTDHIRALRNCMGKNNWGPPSKRDPPRSCR